ncbi:hypothetical protein AAFC00_002570 [Neodothiora populina]|uniref:SPX domain-containing protein n=1 Tax=Neodothiora populina TaxID=2781224 RepID=A0ABR3P8V9_9PEZI
MKYGASLRAHSIPAWAHHNIDYDEIKHFIKENTTPGNGSTISIPGTGDTRGQEIEHALFDILCQQHKRINLFVWSKTGEIKRRLDHLDKQTKELRSRGSQSQTRITAKRLERYGRLESDVLKAGEELRSLSRFITAQQTAFRKLIKKHKKWTRSSGLELSFNKEVLGDSGSFTKVDLEPLLIEWEEILDAVRILYEERMRGSLATTSLINSKPQQQSLSLRKAVAEFREVVQSSSHTKFDTFFATLPLGDGGRNAAYWVHPDNVVELQVLLLQHTRSHAVRRQSVSSTPIGTASRNNSQINSTSSRRGSTSAEYDTGLLVIDDQTDFVQKQSSTTLEARENNAGVRLQNANVAARWTQEDEAIIARQTEAGAENTGVVESMVKRKYLAAALNPESSIPARKASNTEESSKQIEELRSWFSSNPKYQPLVTITSSRQRFTDIAADSSGFLLSTLDKSISMKESALNDLDTIDSMTNSSHADKFPFAVLRVHQEGTHASNLLRVLDNSHLVERVRGFSLEYHAVWQCHKPENTVPPFWIPLLEKEIRKLPKSVGWGKRDHGVYSNFGSQATTPNMSASNTSESGHGDTTAVEDQSNAGRISIVDELQSPRLSSFRKKRSQAYAPPEAQRQKYWSEYDNPSDDDEDGAYVLFIDPNAESGFTQTWRSLREIFKGRRASGRQPLLQRDDAMSSSDEEAQTLSNRPNFRQSYGAIEQTDGTFDTKHNKRSPLWLPPVAATCLGASLAIMVVGYLLALTGRKKQYQEVDAGIIFAVVSSLLFAISGVASMSSTGVTGGATVPWTARLIALAVLAVDAIASGALLAWILS